MKIIFLLTERPDAMCGVYDYTRKLADSIRQYGVAVELEIMPRWSYKNLRRILKKYSGQDIRFHIQYPSLDMGNSIAPGLLPWLTRLPVFLTLHEFTVFNDLRKRIFLPQAISARKIIFTNSFEVGRFRHFFPFAAGKTAIIPIGNNIPMIESQTQVPPIRERIIYFGQISGNKGIEFFIDIIRALRQSAINFDAAFIGSMLDENSAIAASVRQAASDLNIDLALNLSAADVSAELQKSTIALLPFPDGITEKRGSALACLEHGNTVLTIHSDITPDWLRQTTFGITSVGNAVDLVKSLIDHQRERHPHAAILAQAMESRQWDNIALRHIELYQQPKKF